MVDFDSKIVDSEYKNGHFETKWSISRPFSILKMFLHFELGIYGIEITIFG